MKFNWKTFVVTNDAKYIVVAGYWDNSIRVMTSRGKHVACLVRHLDMVTCLWLDYRGVYMMSGSYDSTCIIWKISTSGSFKAQPVHILHGHEDLVTCVHLNTELDVALSSSKVCDVISWSMTSFDGVFRMELVLFIQRVKVTMYELFNLLLHIRKILLFLQSQCLMKDLLLFTLNQNTTTRKRLVTK